MIKQLLGVPAGTFSNQVVDLCLSFILNFIHAGTNSRKQTASGGGWPSSATGFNRPQATDRLQEEMLDAFLLNPYTEEYSVRNLARFLCYSSRQLSRKLYALTG